MGTRGRRGNWARSLRFCRWTILAVACPLLIAAGDDMPAAPEPDPQRFADAIKSFERWDSKNAWPRDAVLFAGSSSIVMWHTHAAFPDWPVINRGFVDTMRLYVFGCSGGGVLTAWIVGHTDRFAAASSNCPVTNWMSFVGTTDSPGWYRNFEKPFWEDPSEHLKRSPIMYVGNVKTPTMLMTGVQDLRTPMPQTEEFYSALKYRKVPTAMIRFNNEGHGTSSTPSNFLRTQLYLRSWFERWPQKVAAQ